MREYPARGAERRVNASVGYHGHYIDSLDNHRFDDTCADFLVPYYVMQPVRHVPSLFLVYESVMLCASSVARRGSELYLWFLLTYQHCSLHLRGMS